MQSLRTNGRNIVIRNGRCIIDGKDLTDQLESLTIIVEGNVDSLSVDACHKIDVKGNVKDIKTTSGDISCNGPANSISTLSGDVDIEGDIAGNISTMSGDVEVSGSIKGNVSTMSGDISTR